MCFYVVLGHTKSILTQTFDDPNLHQTLKHYRIRAYIDEGVKTLKNAEEKDSKSDALWKFHFKI